MLEHLLAELVLIPRKAPTKYPGHAFGDSASKLSALTRDLRRAIPRLRALWNQNRRSDEPSWGDGWQPDTIYVDKWAYPEGYSDSRKRLRLLLETLKDRCTEQQRPIHPAPEAATPASSEAQAGPPPETPGSDWRVAPDGHVVVRVAGQERIITAPRRAQLFQVVASGEGRTVTWKEALQKLMQDSVDMDPETGEQVVVCTPITKADTLRNYGNQIAKKDLHPFGGLWQQDGSGARWTGGPRLTDWSRAPC